MRLSRLFAVVAAVVVAFALGYATRRGGESPAPPVAGPPVLTDVVRQVLVDRYVHTLDPNALASARTVPQLLAQLRDPFTSYLTSAQYAALRADTREGFYGVGVRVRPVGTALRIVGVVPKSPAARAGLRKGDMLLAVDGRRVSGRLDTAQLAGLPSDDVQAALVALPGIGPWTASYVRMRVLGDRDAFPAADLGVIKALEALGIARADHVATAERWRPWRAYAVLHLWESLAD